MYRYDEFDHAFLRDRVAEFRDQVRRRLAGELTEDQFKPLRLMNGLYLQLHAYMLRVAIPYGALNGRQLRKLAHIARTYDKGYGHFTTRTNLQFNWIKLGDVPAILSELAEVEMHAIQTSGNCIRNVTADPYAGAAADEIDDPRLWGEVIRQWSTFHPEFSFLPRKFKIAVIASRRDRRGHAHPRHRPAAGDGRGGPARLPGLRRRRPGPHALPRPGDPRASCRASELLCYLTADPARLQPPRPARQHPQGAHQDPGRTRWAIEAFREEVEAGLGRDAPGRPATCRTPSSPASRAYFAPPPFEDLPARSDAFDRANWPTRRSPASPATTSSRTRVQGYASALISLKPLIGEPGDATAEQMDAVADLAERYGFDDVRVTYEQNLVLPHVKLDDLPAVFQALQAAGTGHAQRGPGHRHHRLPGPRLLRARQRPLDPDRPGPVAPAGRPRPAGKDRRAADQDVGLHQRLRPPPRRPHRHAGRR